MDKKGCFRKKNMIDFENDAVLTCIVNRLEGELVRYHLLEGKGSNFSRKRGK